MTHKKNGGATGALANQSTDRRYLNEVELAGRLGLSVQFLRKRRDRGEAPYHSKFGHRVLYSIKEIESYEEAALRKHTPPQRCPESTRGKN